MDKNLSNQFADAFNRNMKVVEQIPEKFGAQMKKIGTSISSAFSNIFKKPSSKKDYVRIGKTYISIKFLIISIVIFAILIYLLFAVFFPWANGNLWTANVKLNSPKYYSFTGKKVKLIDQNGIVIYRGSMVSGAITGNGIQYDSSGNMIYNGEFLDGDYSGRGKLYNNGVLVYSGEFLQSLYDGDGELYDNTGKILYKGSFESGQKSGVGTEYDISTGNVTYLGAFVNNQREGKGEEFSADGKKLYEGEFLSGKYGGVGKLFENEILKYSGNFVNGVYEGSGILYDIDSRAMIYNGGFVNGLYEGEGTLYDVKSSKVIYQGSFVAGKRSGTGTSFDRLGAISFSGEFKDDAINYLNYLGKKLDDVLGEFGEESYRENTNDGQLILTYLNNDVSIVFKAGGNDGTYQCSKVVLGNKNTFLGLKPSSSRSEISEAIGKSPYSSINYEFQKYYDIIFKQLSIDLRSSEKTLSDKFIMDSYYIRFYYDSSGSKYLAVEISNV